MRIEFVEHTIRRVYEHYVKGFKPKRGEKIYNWETNYDPQTGKVIFKLYIQEKEKP